MRPRDSPCCRHLLSPRTVLRQSALGFGSWPWPTCSHAADTPAAAKAPHFAPRAKRVIFLFMKGGPSHVDTFDPKPLLDRDDGKPYPGERPRVVFAADRQPAQVAVEVQAVRPVRQPGQRTVPARRRVRGRHLLPPLAARHQPGPRRGGAEAAHRQRQLRPPEHGGVGGLRAGHREREPAGVRHHLPDARPRRGEQLGVGVPAGRLPGGADRQRQHARRAGEGPLHRQRDHHRATSSGGNSTCSPRPEPRPPRPRPARTRRWRGGSTRSSWRSACRRRCRRPRTSRRRPPRRRSSTGWTTR